MPKNLQSSIAQRLWNLKLHNNDVNLQRLAYALCAKDVRVFFNDWVWTYDPRLEIAYIPMELFPKQEDFLTWLEARESIGEDGIAEKSRDMGFTWLCAGFLVHHWLFRDGFKGAIGSRKEHLVDRIGDPDSIFEKIRMVLKYLPKWMMPSGFDLNNHDNFCKLINPATGATITGEAGDNIGRGGRSSIYIIDEAAFLERPRKVDSALSYNTNTRIYVSTPNGAGNLFYRKRHSGKIPVFTMHWRDDPRKNNWELIDSHNQVVDTGTGAQPGHIPPGCIIRYPWYEREKIRLADPVIIAQELDIDYTASIEGVAIPATWVRSAVRLNERINLPANPLNLICGLDVADGGDNDSVLTFRSGAVVTEIHNRRSGGTTETANWALDLALAAKARAINYDCVGVGAGVASTFNIRKRAEMLKIVCSPINVGTAPTAVKWATGRTSQEMFKNLRAELWWIMRSRFERTYDFVENGVYCSPDELISIPDNSDLIQQLSSVLCHTTETGKIAIEKKSDMRSRGVSSPDAADSLMLTFAPVIRPAKMAVGGERTEVSRYVPR